MIVLLDTSTPVCKLTLIKDEERNDVSWQADRELAKNLLSFLEAELSKRSASLRDITAIGVFQGPGSFTGLRIGLAVMNTLADALGIPIVGEVGDDWQDKALQRLNAGENQQIILPLYGSDAIITKPRK